MKKYSLRIANRSFLVVAMVFCLPLLPSLGTGMHAQTVEEMLSSMPDSIIPYATAEQRPSFFDAKVRLFEFAKVDENVFCLLRHLKTPEPDTTVELYDSQWQLIREVSFEDIPLAYLIDKPDTMSNEDYKNILKLSEFPLYDITIPKDSDKNKCQTLNLRLHIPMLSADDKKRIEPLFSEYTLTWDGKTFK